MIRIDNKTVSNDSPVYIIAEVSANHNQSFEIAKEMIKAAYEAGADAVKLQTYTPDTITLKCDNEYFQIKQGTIWDGKTLYELYEEAYTPWEWQPELKKYADSIGITLFSSPFDKSAVDFLEKMNVPAYKIASFEITDIPLIEYAASKGKPMIISTGIATLCDIEEAVNACRRVGNDKIVLLKCTSAYPAPLEDANLETIPNLSETFGVIAGFSDHTLGITAPVAAVTLGAKVIEKHFILDKSMGGPDAAFSLDIDEFKEMVKAVRDTEKLLGKVDYSMSDKKRKSREFSRSLFVAENIREGEILTEKNIRSVRPGYGLHPKYLKDILGKRAATDLEKGTPLKWEHIS
ncbi:pseudaminic acid synthase [Nitrosophilus alvini]|uniref:pseudaminic acid synthase n=1 Tax=Nitrosophilus alvini TaxID=2714855 RepID=UPI0019091A89|nr:pseudaminic acid synthase [Nitrosophilus alvini]